MTASLATNKFGNLTYWTNTDPQSLPTESSTTTTSLKNAFDAVSNTRMIQSFTWANATARLAQAGMVEGDIGDQADTDSIYRYSGSAWVLIVGDTGWITLAPAVNWTATVAIQYRKIGSIVYVKGAPTKSSAPGVADTISAALPVGFRPLNLTSISAISSGGSPGAVGVQPTGVLSAYPVSGSSGNQLNFSGSFPAEQ